MVWLSTISSAIPALGAAFNLFGHKGKSPASAANKYLSQIPGQAHQAYDPYVQAGQGAMTQQQEQIKNLFGGQTQNMLGESFKESPGYQYALKQALEAGNNAAAAGGMLGTPAHEQQNMEIGQGLASKDFNDYMNRQQDLYKTGFSGNQDINHMGLDANKQIMDLISQVLAQQGSNAYNTQAGKNAGQGDSIKALMQALSQMLGGGQQQQQY